MWKTVSIIVLLIIVTISVAVLAASSDDSTGTPENTRDEEKPECITISPGDDIQDAVNSLSDGGKLILTDGSYDTLEAVLLEARNDLVLEGLGEVWINTKGIDHHVLTFVDCHNITLSNVKAQHVILEEGDNAPIEDARDGAVVGIIGGSEFYISGCELVGCGIYGVYADSVTPVYLEDCYLHDNAKSALLFVTGARTMHAYIRDCIITRNAGSIETRGDVEVIMEGNNLIERNSPDHYGR